ncbi:MAG: FMN-binding protein [Candidatus Omnitrophica bacterium]|nr:FMN-binding protein [Candidatus Omnitrophota bacterium]
MKKKNAGCLFMKLKHFKRVGRKFTIIYFFVLITFNIFTTHCLAVTLLLEKEALIKVLPDYDEIVTESKTFSESEINAVKIRLGENLGSNPQKIDFYFAVKDGAKAGTAIILEEPGNFGTMKIAVGLTMQGKVYAVKVISFTDSRGRSVVRGSFLKQFIGKSGIDPFGLNKDVIAVSGATASSGGVAFIIKKAVILYEQAYL